MLLVFLRAFPFVRNHAGGGGCDARLSRHAARFFTYINRLFLPSLHFQRKVISLARAEGSPWNRDAAQRTGVFLFSLRVNRLEIKLALQINEAVRRRRGKRPADQTV